MLLYSKKEKKVDTRTEIEKLIKDYTSNNIPKRDYIVDFPNNKFENMRKFQFFHELHNYMNVLLKMTSKRKLIRDKNYHMRQFFLIGKKESLFT